MSTEIAIIEGTGKKNAHLTVTSFRGPEGKGPMVQLTQGLGGANTPGYIQLTKQDARKVVQELIDWFYKY